MENKLIPKENPNLLLNLKEICDFLDKEAEYYYNERKNLIDNKDILYENYYNRFSNYAECCKDLKSSFLILIMEKNK